MFAQISHFSKTRASGNTFRKHFPEKILASYPQNLAFYSILRTNFSENAKIAPSVSNFVRFVPKILPPNPQFYGRTDLVVSGH